MEEFQIGVTMLSCVFNVVLILMMTISILLIYSLLMVSVGTKTYETGVMRMVGVTRTDCILLVTMQCLAFVVPALILSYVMACVGNWGIF